MGDARPPRPRSSRPRTGAASGAAGGAVPPAEAPQRIAKLLARAGVGSRRDVERMIAEGRVALAGRVLDTPATLLVSLAGVTVDGQPVAAAEPTRMWRFHKPTGCLTTARDPAGRPTIFELLPPELPRLLSIGRLDYNTEGLLLLTNDGELKRRFELPANEVERVYRARVRGRLDHGALADLAEGITIEGVRYGSIIAEVEASQGMTHWLSLRLREGKNREVRNVLGFLGLQVARLIRVRYGDFDLGELAPGGIEEVPAVQVAWAQGQRHNLRAGKTADRETPGRPAQRRGGATPEPAAPSRLVVEGHRVRARRPDEMEPIAPEGVPVVSRAEVRGGRSDRRSDARPGGPGGGKPSPASRGDRRPPARAGAPEAGPTRGRGTGARSSAERSAPGGEREFGRPAGSRGAEDRGSGSRGPGGRRAARARQRHDEDRPAPGERGEHRPARAAQARPTGERPAGKRPTRERPARERPAGDLPSGDRTFGKRPFSGRASEESPARGRPGGGGKPRLSGGGRPGKPRGRRS